MIEHVERVHPVVDDRRRADQGRKVDGRAAAAPGRAAPGRGGRLQDLLRV